MANDIDFLKQGQSASHPAASSGKGRAEMSKVEFSKPQDKSALASDGKLSWWSGLTKKLGGLLAAKNKSASAPVTPPAKPAAEIKPIVPKKEVPPPPVTKISINQEVGKTILVDRPNPAAVSPSAKPIQAPASAVGAKTVPINKPFSGNLAGVNLIPSEERADLSRRAWLAISLAGLGAVALIVAAYLGLVFYRSQQVAASEQLQNKVTSLQAQVEQVSQQTEKALAFQMRLQAVSGLLSARLNWLPLFAFLERTVVPSVSYSSLAADSGGKVTLIGIAGSYTDVAKQMRALENSNEVTAVEVGGLKLNQRGEAAKPSVSFSFTITLAPQVFNPQASATQ
jgi:Tfp pilus assembly protein PilN